MTAPSDASRRPRDAGLFANSQMTPTTQRSQTSA
jgi:hypothetical protein